MQANPAAPKHKNSSVPPRGSWIFLKLRLSAFIKESQDLTKSQQSLKALRCSSMSMMVKPLRIVCAERWIQEFKNWPTPIQMTSFLVIFQKWVGTSPGCIAMLSVWAINGTSQIKLQLINTNTVGHHFLHKPAEPLGHLPRLKMWETKEREPCKLQKIHQVWPWPSQRAMEGSSLKSLTLNAVTGQCRCNLCVNTSVLQKPYNNSLLQLPWVMFLSRIKIFLQGCTQRTWAHKTAQGSYQTWSDNPESRSLEHSCPLLSACTLTVYPSQGFPHALKHKLSWQSFSEGDKTCTRRRSEPERLRDLLRVTGLVSQLVVEQL